MGYLSKIVHGTILEDQFSNVSLFWELTPNIPERLLSNENGTISLTRNETNSDKVYLLIDLPNNDDFVFYTRFSHLPTELKDIAGFVVFGNSETFIELQSYNEYNNTTYNECKIIKKSNFYYFYARRIIDGKWIYIGGSEIDIASKIGYFIEGPYSESTKDLTLDYMAFFYDNYIGFEAIPPRYIVKIRNSDGVIIAAKQQGSETKRLLFDTSIFTLPLKDVTVSIIDADTNTIVLEEEVQTMSSGDVFTKEENILFFLNDDVLTTGETIDFGILRDHITEFDFSVQNIDFIPLFSKKLSVFPVSNFFEGESLIKLSFINSDGLPIEYTDVIEIKTINPNETIKMKLKIERTEFNNSFYKEKLKVKLILE